MKPIYKSLALAAMTLQVSLALHAETRDDESASTMALQADLLDSLRVELVALNVSGARNLIESGECVIEGSNLTITLDTSEWTRGAMYRVQVLATFGTQTQVIYALNVTVPYYIALSDVPQEFEDNVTIVSTITDVTEEDLEGLALEETSQEIKAAITPISAAAEAYDVGKTQLAQAITSKGVETSPTETYPQMADKVTQIVQTQQVIDGGEMYAKQLFGVANNDIVPGYWNLYEIMAQLLSDGRLVNYGGILLAEYYKGYDSLALSGAGSGGAYVVSDKDSNGNFIMYTNDITHVWDANDDGKGNRWVAYCFANAGHDFDISDTNTSPRTIHIGRNVGTVTSLVTGRTSEIVVTDGNKLGDFRTGTYKQNWNKRTVLRNFGVLTSTVLYYPDIESLYIKADGVVGAPIIMEDSSNTEKHYSIIADIGYGTPRFVVNFENSIGKIYVDTFILKGVTTFDDTIQFFLHGARSNGDVIFADLEEINAYLSLFTYCKLNRVYLLSLEKTTNNTRLIYGNNSGVNYLYLGYKTNDSSKSVSLGKYGTITQPTDIELKDGYLKNLDISGLTDVLTAENIALHMLNRLGTCTEETGQLALKIGATNLATIQNNADYSSYLTDAVDNKGWSVIA